MDQDGYGLGGENGYQQHQRQQIASLTTDGEGKLSSSSIINCASNNLNTTWNLSTKVKVSCLISNQKWQQTYDRLNASISQNAIRQKKRVETEHMQ